MRTGSSVLTALSLFTAPLAAQRGAFVVRLGNDTVFIESYTRAPERLEGDQISLQDIFVYKQTGFENGKVSGFHTATGAIPRIMEVLVSTGNEVPVQYFDPAPNSGYVKQKRIRAVAEAA